MRVGIAGSDAPHMPDRRATALIVLVAITLIPAWAKIAAATVSLLTDHGPNTSSIVSCLNDAGYATMVAYDQDIPTWPNPDGTIPVVDEPSLFEGSPFDDKITVVRRDNPTWLAIVYVGDDWTRIDTSGATWARLSTTHLSARGRAKMVRCVDAG